MKLFQHTLIDALAAMPLLFAVYFLLGLLHKHLTISRHFSLLATKAGPIIGALCGSIPQCGFSAASAALFNAGAIGLGTLAAVFLATSDEALFVLLAYPHQRKTIVLLFFWKIVIAVFWGYCFYFFAKRLIIPEPQQYYAAVSLESHQHGSLWLEAMKQTLKMTVFLFVAMLMVNCLIDIWGIERLATLLFYQPFAQPFLTALIGLIPGCSVSIFLTMLYVNDVISFGATVSGLSVSAGFGYLILLRTLRWRVVLIIACIYAAAVISGIFLDALI